MNNASVVVPAVGYYLPKTASESKHVLYLKMLYYLDIN